MVGIDTANDFILGVALLSINTLTTTLMEKIPPFQPGDRIIHVGDTDASGIVEDEKYTIDSVYWCCENTGWRVYLAEIRMAQLYLCSNCDRRAPGWPAVNFRKLDDISDHTVESLLEELAPSIKDPVLN